MAAVSIGGKLLELARLYFPLDISSYPKQFLEKMIEIEKERLDKLAEIGERTGYFFNEPQYDKGLLRWKQATDEAIAIQLERAEKIISNFQFPISIQNIEKAFLDEIGEGDKGALLWPLRVALTGLRASPGPFEILETFFNLPDGKEIITSRIRNAIAKI